MGRVDGYWVIFHGDLEILTQVREIAVSHFGPVLVTEIVQRLYNAQTADFFLCHNGSQVGWEGDKKWKESFDEMMSELEITNLDSFLRVILIAIPELSNSIVCQYTKYGNHPFTEERT